MLTSSYPCTAARIETLRVSCPQDHARPAGVAVGARHAHRSRAARRDTCERARPRATRSRSFTGTHTLSHRNPIDDVDGVLGVAADLHGVAWISGEVRVRDRDRDRDRDHVVYEAKQPLGAGDVALDATCVYWSEPGRGRLRRAPR